MKKILCLVILAIMLVATAATAFAAAKVENLELTGGLHTVSYQFTLEGSESAKLIWQSSQEKGSAIIYPDENGVYAGVIEVPATYPANNVYISIQNASGKRTLIDRQKVTTSFEVTEPAEQAAEGRLKGVTVCIDPGHYIPGGGKSLTEPKGPGLEGTSSRGGQAQGKKTRRYEYIVCFEIAQLFRDRLLSEGATVIMTKTDPNQFASNIERATAANDGNADFFIRLHCNSSSNTGKRGIQVYVPLHSDYARAVADSTTYLGYAKTMCDAMKNATGTKAAAFANDTYVASNWAKMPAFLIELGYMSNLQEDVMLSDPDYQLKLVEGMLNGIEELAVIRGVIAGE